VDRVDAASVLTRQLACSLEQAQGMLARVPGKVPGRFYPQHAARLRRALEQSGVIAEVLDPDGRSAEASEDREE
jgi:hypothetical protein